MRRAFVILGRLFVLLLGGIAAALSMHVETAHLVIGGAVAGAVYLLVLILSRPGPLRVSRKMVVIFWCCALLLLPWAVLRQHFGPFSLSALMFHLEAGLGDKIPDGTVAPLVAATALMLCFAHAFFMSASRLPWGGVALGLASVLFIAANPLAQFAGLNAYFAAVGAPAPVLEEAHPPKLSEGRTAQATAPNLVLIYLEGLERTYGAPVFGDAYQPLRDLEAEALAFTNVTQLPLTDWTTAGLVASQCGYPMVPRGLTQHNRTDTEGGIFAARTCLGDVLAAQGYRNVAVMGVEAAFGGVAAFLKAHHTDELLELSDLRAAGATDESGWGYQDGETFRAALRTLRALEERGAPYAMSVVTIGPHGPNGYVSQECRTDGISGEEPDILLAVNCTARLARDFVHSARNVVDPDNTLFVLLSDHLAHPRVSAISELIGQERRNTALMLGAGVTPGDVPREGSMIDLYPTILDVMGLDVTGGEAAGVDVPDDTPKGLRAGLGVSLLSDLPRFGAGQSNWLIQQRLRHDQDFASWLWATPQDREGHARPVASGGDGE